MFKNIIILFILFTTNLYAHHLPKCPGEKRNFSTWVNCSGTMPGEGHTYSGDLDAEGKYSGYGILKKEKEGMLYEGEILKDKFHGKGKVIWSGEKKFSYDGDWFMGNWHGKGRLESHDENGNHDGEFSYEGEFQNYAMTGYGTLCWKGVCATGNWKDGNCNDEETCKQVKAANEALANQ